MNNAQINLRNTNWIRNVATALAVAVIFATPPIFATDVLRWKLGDAYLAITEDGRSYLSDAKGVRIAQPVKAFKLGYDDGSTAIGERVEANSYVAQSFVVHFSNGARARYAVIQIQGTVLFELKEILDKREPTECFLFMIAAPDGLKVAPWINTVTFENGLRVGVMTTSINAIPLPLHAKSAQGDREECAHTFKIIPRDDDRDIESGDLSPVAEFKASSKRAAADGWAFIGREFDAPLDLSRCVKLRARVYGDGKREALKVQLGGRSGHRDDYIDVDFVGWRVCELSNPALNDLTYDDVRNLYFYYNGLPAKTDVRCLIDWVEAILVDEHGNERAIRLEDFSDENSPFKERGQTLVAKSYARHKLAPASCALVAVSKEKWARTVQNVQKLARVPSPQPGGAWRGESPFIHENYLFLTWFNAKEYDAALQMAKRGGFKQILLLQNSWTTSTGHYRVNENNFPGGVDSLRDVIERFRSEGIRFGLHLLGASVDANDPYLTPIPDKRFVTDYESTLAEALPGEKDAKTIKVEGDATKFPSGQDPYMGSGQLVRIDDELIMYGRTTADGLYDCERGYYGTTIAGHEQGAAVKHFTRAYGYHLPDLDTDFIDEIAGNFAELANQLPIEMIYFDGSELLQRPGEGSEHWYYNARLHKAFYDKLANKDMLFQGSSCSPYSWHMIARNASADGHDDLKAYLEERSGGFTREHASESYLDVGWYYAYDKNATPDMYEYCLGATLAYDASFSFQTSVSAASSHPFIGEILDMINEYQTLRLSGAVTDELRSRFEIDKRLAGRKTSEERDALLKLRNEFHLEKDAHGKRSFRRVLYPSWQNVYGATNTLGGTTRNDAAEDQGAYVWKFNVDQPCAIGFQTHFFASEEVKDAKIERPKITISRREGEKEMIVAELEANCELSAGQFAFVLPGQSLKIYGAPLNEPQTIETNVGALRLEPGEYQARFELAPAGRRPARVRLPLYTDEVFTVD